MTVDQRRLSRRALLGMLAAAGAAACTRPAGRQLEPTAAATATRGASPSPSAVSQRPRPRRPYPEATSEFAGEPYEPIAGDVYPNAKRLAGRFVQSLTTYDADVHARRAVRAAARPADRDFDVQLAERRARALIIAGAESRSEIVYPQLGGLTLGHSLGRISVMVVVRQHLRLHNGDDHTVTRTVDVRLINRDDEWQLEELADPGGRPVPRRRRRLSRIAREVLDDDRIELPDSARWDIHAGIIDDRLLKAMHGVADVFPYSVAVLKSGHPHNVFGTDRVSGHTMGRGVDIWKVDGTPVVDQKDDDSSPAHTFTTALLEDFGAPELGSPWDLDGPPQPGSSRPSFTDPVHADHIHLAFKAP